MVYDNDLPSIKALKEDGKARHFLIVSQEKYAREIDGIRILPWEFFWKCYGLENLVFNWCAFVYSI